MRAARTYSTEAPGRTSQRGRTPSLCRGTWRVWEGEVGDLQLRCGAEGVEGAVRAAALRAAAEEVGRAGGWR